MTTTPNLEIPLISATDGFVRATFNNALSQIDSVVAPLSHIGDTSHFKLWKPSTIYEIDDVVKALDTPSWGYWVCTTAGTSGATEITGNNEGDTITDSTVIWQLAKLRKPITTHNDLTGRGATDSHPQSAITNLVTDLGTIATAVAGKVDKVTGMGLSTNDFTTVEKDKITHITITQDVDLDTLETNSHTHTNKTELDKIGEDANANLTYNGNAVIGGAKDWATGTAYIVNQLITYNTILYKCITAHTSTTFSADASKWEQVMSDIPAWTTALFYPVGAKVYTNNMIYRCITAHTSATFSTDSANWSLIYSNIRDWVATTYYRANEVIFVSSTLYKCATAHTAGTSFDATEKTYWSTAGTNVGISSMTYDGTASKLTVTLSDTTTQSFSGIGQNFYEGYKKTDIITAPITAVGVQDLSYDVTAQDFINISAGVSEGFLKSQNIKVSDIVWSKTLGALNQNTALGSTGSISLSGTSALTADNTVYFKVLTAPTAAGNLAGMVIGVSNSLGGTYSPQSAFASGTTSTITINGITITFTVTTGQTFIVGEIYYYTTTVDSPTTFLIDGYNGTNSYAVVVHFKGNNRLSVDSLVSSGWTIPQIVNACGYKGQSNNVTALKGTLLYSGSTAQSANSSTGNPINYTMADSMKNYDYLVCNFISSTGVCFTRLIKMSDSFGIVGSSQSLSLYNSTTYYTDGYISYISTILLQMRIYSSPGYGAITLVSVYGLVSGDGKVTISKSLDSGKYTLTLTNVDGTSTVELPYVTLLNGNVAEISGDNTLHITHADSSVTIGEAKEKYDTLWNGTPVGNSGASQTAIAIPLSNSLTNYRKFGVFTRETQSGGGSIWPEYKEFFVDQLSYVIANASTSELVICVGQGTTTGYAKIQGGSSMTNLIGACSYSVIYKIIGIY